MKKAKWLNCNMLMVLMVFLCSCSSTSSRSVLKVSENHITPVTIDNKIEDSEVPNIYFRVNLVDSNVEELNTGKNQYYKLKRDELNQLNLSFMIDNSKIDTNITLIALQGRDVTDIKLKKGSDWYKAIELPSKLGSSNSIDFSVKWDSSSSEELIIFPIIEEARNMYTGASLGVIRWYIEDASSNNFFTEKDLQTHKLDIPQEEYRNVYPTLSWLNFDGTKVKVRLIDSIPSTQDEYNTLSISKLSQDAMIDVIYVNNLGQSKLISSDNKLVRDKKHELTLKEISANNNKDKKFREFYIIVNHKNKELLKDMIAVKEGHKLVSTSFQQVIEVIPVSK
ncbi:hypothetical protein K0T92_11930 [Paenibacillus oenotherae]|uniref:Lipoprotein n=1 Tax=Paenibacillus oenotherae TaxID=1435645 RepID=A0ABS7D696_9BACL|nr:hypothetical protein [Paenibacillus oenotherae]MBW7475459.1 hypothetical protein [Paenibacillus oenotherae]